MRHFLLILGLLAGCGSDTSEGWLLGDGLDAGMDLKAEVGPAPVDAAPDTAPDMSDPDLLEGGVSFFNLPINSYRVAVSTYDKAQDICVSVIFYLDGPTPGPFCANDFEEFSPYVVVDRGMDCWDYGGNAEFTAATGCVDFAELGGVDEADLEMNVTSDLYTGRVTFLTP